MKPTTNSIWAVDKAHSELSFKVRHLMISTVTGHFPDFSVDAATDAEGKIIAESLKVVINADSVTTNNTQRDTHLRSAEFFDIANHPKITFIGTRYDGSATEGKLSGELTIKGITKPVVLHIEHGGNVVDPYGQEKTAFTIETKISRSEFGLTWNAVTEAGGVVVSDEIRIAGEIQLIKQA